MSRAGRKRRIAQQRQIRLSTPPVRRELSPREVARTQPHRSIVGDDAVHDPRCETPVGCLAVIGAIPDREYAAAERMRQIVLRYRQAIAAPGPVGSISGVGLPQARSGFEIAPDEHADRLLAYREARRAVENSCGLGCWQMVLPIIADGQPVPAKGFRSLMAALQRLATAFEADRQVRSLGQPSAAGASQSPVE